MLANTVLVTLVAAAGVASASSHDARSHHEKVVSKRRIEMEEERDSKLSYVSMPEGFSSKMTGIGSWFEADSSRDSTDGTSWCNIKYESWMPLFAPKFSTMSPSKATWGTDPKQWEEDASRYCGLEAKVSYNGNSKLMYIGDAFDDAWCRTDGSIDILTDYWQELAGESADSKEKVMEGLTWELTGKKNSDYAFNG